MNIPKLKKIKSEKKYHDIVIKDNYSWVDQPNILEVLQDSNKLLPEVRQFIDKNNVITDNYFKDVKNLQAKLFNEIKESKELMDLIGKSTIRELSTEEKDQFKTQFYDILKSMPSLAIFLLPGGAILLPIVIKLFPDLLPSAFKENIIDDKKDEKE